MKKRFIISFLVVISIILGIGGIAYAASPPDNKPPDVWDAILDGVEYIRDTLDAVGPFIVGKLNAIDDKVDSLSQSIIIMESDAGVHEMTTLGEETLVATQTYDQVAHVTLTVKAYGYTGDDLVWAELSWEDGVENPEIFVIDSGAGIYKDTVEFAAKEWTLKAFDDDAWTIVYWAYTVTYPASSPE